MSAAEVERAAHAATVALSEFDRAGVTTVLQTVPALALTLRELLAAVTAPAQPADDVRELVEHLNGLMDSLDESVSILQVYEQLRLAWNMARALRPHGTVTDAEVEAAARSLASLAPGEEWPSNDSLGGNASGTRDDEYHDNLRDIAREALTAAREVQP